MNKFASKSKLKISRRLSLTLASFAALAISTHGLRADTLDYNGGTGNYAGGFTDVSVTPNTTSVTPTVNDDAVFNISSNNAVAETITLANGATANSFTITNTGTTAFTGGTLTLGGSTTDATAPGLTVQAGAGAVSFAESITLGASQTWTNNTSTTVTLGTASAGINITGAASTGTASAPELLTLSTGSFTQGAGSISNGSGGVLGLVISNNGSYNDGKGTVQTYSGGTTVLSGFAGVNNGAGLGTGTITIGDTTVTNSATAATVRFSTNGTVSNNIVVQGGGTESLQQGSASSSGTQTLTFSGTVTLNNTVPLVLTTSASSTGNAPAETFNNVISGSGGVAVTQNNRNTFILNLNAANTYTGGTTLSFGTTNINNSGTATSSAIGTGPLTIGSVSIDNTSGAAVTVATNNTVTINGNFAYGGTSSLNLGTGAVSLGTATGTTRTITTNAATTGTALTIGGVISNGTTATGITKGGTGTLVLNGVNNYTGTTSVTAGTLGGSGTIAGLLSMAANTTLSPGSAATAGNVGTLTVGALTLASTTALAYDLGTPTANSDLIAVNGALTLAGQLTVNGGTGFGAGNYDLINYTGALTNNTLTVASLPAGYTGSIDTTTVPGEVLLDVTIAAVPEPSTWIAGFLGLGLVGFALNKRRGAATLNNAASRMV